MLATYNLHAYTFLSVTNVFFFNLYRNIYKESKNNQKLEEITLNFVCFKVNYKSSIKSVFPKRCK